MDNIQKKDISLQQKTSDSKKIYKFLLELYTDDIDHADMQIWRILEIPQDYSFFDLHVAIQDSLVWLDVELHKFDMKNPVTKEMEYIGIEDDLMCEAIVFEKDALIAEYFTVANSKCMYTYNFLKPWTFRVTLEKILQAIPNIKYPRCVDGNGMVAEETDDKDNYTGKDLLFDLKNIQFRDPEVAWLDAFQGF